MIFMSETLVMLLILALSLFGVVQMIRILSISLIYPQKNERVFMVVSLKESVEDPEILLRGAVVRLRWLGIKNSTIIALDNGVSKEMLEICKQMERSYQEIMLMSEDELCEYLKST